MSDLRRWTDDSKSPYARVLRTARRETVSEEAWQRAFTAITAKEAAPPKRRGTASSVALGVGICALMLTGMSIVQSGTARRSDVATVSVPSADVLRPPEKYTSDAIAIDELPTVVTAAPAATPPASSASTGKATPASGGSSTSPAARTPSPGANAGDDLAAEVALLRAVRHDLRAGGTAQALEKLTVYDARFPHGIMREEARVERVEALIRAGSPEQGRALGRRMLEESPSSPFARKLRALIGDGEASAPVPSPSALPHARSW